MNYYQKPLNEIFAELSTSPKGLSDREAILRIGKYGLNQLQKIRRTPLIFTFLAQFTDLMAIILLIMAVLAFLIGEPRDSIIILVIILINASIGFFQEYKAQKILAAFKKHLPSFAKVIREGKLKKILAIQIVPGDVLVLSPGDAVAADARLIEAYELRTNDVALTGESQPQIKKEYQIEDERTLTDIDNMVFMGTSVVEGEGKAVVVATGMETAFGHIARESQAVKEEPTPLQKELTHTGKTVAKIAFGVAVSMLILLSILGRDLKESILFAIAAGAAMVPEGLPAATSVALALGAQRMLKKKALVKKLLHVESLGSVTTICSDKTGTLTTGVMTAVVTHPRLSETPSLIHEQIWRVLVLCNNAAIDGPPTGDPLEIALLKFTEIHQQNINELRKRNPKVDEIPFSARRKMMSVVCKKGTQRILYTKGACLELLKLCRLDEKQRQEIIKHNDEMAQSGLRVLALATKNINEGKYSREDLEKDLHFVGLIGLEDPPREGVAEAVRLCRKAFIKVIMVTGDYGLTALAIARQIGLASDKTQVVTGEQLHQMDEEALQKVLKKEVIFARIDPSQKLRIVQNLQETGEVVAVTGDGVNDAPALVKADIGVAMGKIGTDVAKEASDMILLDDHFATIVNAVKEGRRIFDNAKKFVFYVFSSNAGELMAPLIGILIGLPLPLIAIQILAIDLGTDIFPSLALGVEKEEPLLMSRPPRSKTERIMSINMLAHLLQIGLIMGFLGIVIYLVSLSEGGWTYGQMLSENSNLYRQSTAAVWATLVFCQVANAFSSRSERLSIFQMGWWSNRWLIYAEVISLALLFGVLYLPPLQEIFRTAPLTPLVWVGVILSFAIFLVFAEWHKKLHFERKKV